MEPTVEQLRDWSATKVMGWKLALSISLYPDYYDMGNSNRWIADDWHPDTDLNQLAMVVKAWCGEDSQRWNAMVIEIDVYPFTVWTMDAVGRVLSTAFCNPELILRALYEVANV